MSKISELLKYAFNDDADAVHISSKKLTAKEKEQFKKDVEKAVLDAFDTAKQLLEPFNNEKNSGIAENKSAGTKYEWKSEEQVRDELKKEAVNHPSHYQGRRFEVIDIIDDYGLGFNLGNALKYILRAGHKDDYCQDLRKAVWYLNREIDVAENKKADSAMPRGL